MSEKKIGHFFSEREIRVGQKIIKKIITHNFLQQII